MSCCGSYVSDSDTHDRLDKVVDRLNDLEREQEKTNELLASILKELKKQNNKEDAEARA